MISLFGGDFRILWPENIKEFAQLPLAWDPLLNTGLGVSNIPLLWLNSYVAFTSSFSYLGLSWTMIVLLFWVLPTFLGSFLFATLLFRYFFPHLKYYSLLAGFIYSVNTYFLMVVFGGQMGIGLAYAAAPLVVLSFARLFAQATLRNALLAGLALALQLLFDPRFVYMTLFVVFCLWLFVFCKLQIKYILLCFIVPFCCTVLLHAFWLVPLLLHRGGGIPVELGNVDSFSFFSFADFSHAFSLLHPNWPENIFGKVSFMKPEFLMLPLIAYASLIFLPKAELQLKTKKVLLFFSLLGLFAAFLAKGDNPPFEQINQFLYSSFPGMGMFRDSTKWYTLVALSYAVLIPFTVSNIAHWLEERRNASKSLKAFNLQKYFLLLGLCYFIFLFRPLWLGQVNELFRIRYVPQEYIQLKELLVNDEKFSRTLWIPQWQRYGFFSLTHPALSSQELFKTSSTAAVLNLLKKDQTREFVQDASVKYVIIPFDSEDEIFITDNKYDDRKYKKLIEEMRKITWLREQKSIDKIALFEVANYKDHFWIKDSSTAKVSYKRINPTAYTVVVGNIKKGDQLIFSEGFDTGWNASIGREESIESKAYNKRLNSFDLPATGSYTLNIYYEPQYWLNIGMCISLTTLIGIAGYLVYHRKKGRVSK